MKQIWLTDNLFITPFYIRIWGEVTSEICRPSKYNRLVAQLIFSCSTVDCVGYFATLQLGMGSAFHGARLHERDKVACNVWKTPKLSVSQYLLEGLCLSSYLVVLYCDDGNTT